MSLPKTKQEAEAFAVSIGLPASDGEAMWWLFLERGEAWTKNWQATVQRYRAYGYLPSQKPPKAGAKEPDPKQREHDREYEEFMARKGKGFG